MANEGVADLVEQFVANHVVPDIDGGGESFRIGSAMALDHDTGQPEEHAAIRLARVHLVPQSLEGRTGEQVAEPGAPGARYRRTQQLGDLARGSFRGLDRDVAGDPFGYLLVHI